MNDFKNFLEYEELDGMGLAQASYKLSYKINDLNRNKNP